MARKPFAPTVLSEHAPPQRFFAERKAKSFQPWVIGSERAAPAPPAQDAPDPLVLAFDNARAEGFERGYAEGMALGQQEAANAATELHTRLESSLRTIDTMREALAEAYRRELIELGLGAAEALIGTAYPEGEPIIARLVEQGLEAVGGEESLVLEVSQGDAEAVSAWLENRPETVITVKIDAALVEGDFRLKSPRGSIESIMAQRVDRMRRLVLGELDGGTAS